MEQEIPKAVERLHKTFLSGKTRSLDWRKSQLQNLLRGLEETASELKEVLEKDLGHRGTFFSDVIERSSVAGEAKMALANIDEWTKDVVVSTPLLMQPSKSYVRAEPVGVVTVISPWNYPVSLCLTPLIASISAGNCTAIKPSEVTPNCSAYLKRFIDKYLDSEAHVVIEGGVPETTVLLKQRVDHIFYTGNGAVGKIVMKAAAEHLAGVTLELGGKSPVFVLADADIETASKRILWGKFTNCGQTCVAPDYVMVDKAVLPKLKDALLRNLKKFYGENPKESTDYSRIVNSRHTERLQRTLQAAISKGAKLVTGGEVDVNARYISPTILENVNFDSPVMDEENFGPILPLIELPNLDEAIRYVNSRDHPLALYVFSASTAMADKIFNATRAGGSCLNETVMHVGNPHLPFGGTGPSGVGQYHGKHGFDTLSHQRAVLSKGTLLDAPIRYPPYTPSKMNQLRTLGNLNLSTPVKIGLVSVGLGVAYMGASYFGLTDLARTTLVYGLHGALNFLEG